MGPGLRSAPRLFKEAAKGWKADNCLSMGAALAFYSLLSMAPLMVLVITIAGLVIGRDEAQALLFTQLSGLLGDTGAEGVRTVLDSASSDKEGIIQSVISAFVLLVGATTVFGELQDDLNRIWKAEAPKSAGIWGQVKKRLLSFGLIVVLGFLLLVSLAVSAAVSYLGSVWLAGAAEGLAHALELLGSLAVMTLLFALTFKILPSRGIPWSDVMVGALVTAVLFSIGKFLIGLYIGKSAVASDFGAAGTLVVAILWVYYSSQIFFFGAELTRAYSLGLGSSRQEAANSDFNSDEAAMVARARRIVKGRDPVLVQKRG
jgi:membrane protein